RAPINDAGAPLRATEGREWFTTYLVAAPSCAAAVADALSLGSVDWHLDWTGAFDTNLDFRGGRMQVGHAAIGGRSDAQTGGPAANAMGQRHGEPEKFVATSADNSGSKVLGSSTAQGWTRIWGDYLVLRLA